MEGTRIALQLSRSLPEEQGISSAAITEFLNSLESQDLGLHSFMLLRHGYVVAEGWWNPYRSNLPHMLFSLSKSFTSTAIGFAVTEKLITLEDTVISFFPEEIPDVITDNLAKMRIRDLLIMGTGHVVDSIEVMRQSAERSWVRTFFSVPVEKEPGTHFLYNTGATYMLSAILQKVTGLTLLEYLEPRLFEPLGIIGATWESCPRGVSTGGSGLNLTTEDIAKFGQLYLQQGIWNDMQLLPEEWINEASSKQISSGEGDHEWAHGYGYQFWTNSHGGYRADGAFGQFSMILPDQDAVVAITSGSKDKEAIMSAVWEHLLPAMEHTPLPSDSVAAAILTDQLKNLSINPPLLQSSSTLEEKINGTIYRMYDNENMWGTFSISFNSNKATINLQKHHSVSP